MLIPIASAFQGRVASFGAFRLHATERILEKNGTPLKVGSRALDILIALIERAPEVVGKRELIRRAWGDIVVDDVSLRVHVTALRKRLGEAEPSVSYIANVPGRGYCFSAEVTWTAAEPGSKMMASTATAVQLPRAPLLVVGRDGAVRELASQLRRSRFVSIVGAGGIGKTTIAVALAHGMLAEFRGAVHFFELGALEDPRLLASMLASQLGLVAASDQPMPVILAFLREQKMLLVFDSCEHVIAEVAAAGEAIFRDAPFVHILVTSREALRAEGEQVYHLPPLECPSADGEPLTAARALSFAAVQLFVRQVTNSGSPFELTDAEAPTVAEICRRLDGIALALEITAARVGLYGVAGTASLLDRHFRLLWRGRRTALPRHQTLSATLDWSYNLLSETERLVLRRLAVFVGGFSLAAALEVAAEGLDSAELTETLAALVDKSLVSSDSGTPTQYRLLETTRAYAWQKLAEAGEDQGIVRRACDYLLRALEEFGATVWARPSRDSRHFFVSNLGNLRAALDWCFSDQGDSGLGARLTGAAACLFFEAGFLTECAARTEAAITALAPASKGTPLELELLACFSQAVMVTGGSVPAALAVIVHALEIAAQCGNAPMELYLLHSLYKWEARSGDLRALLRLTDRVATVAGQIADPLAEALASAYRAITCFFTGDNRDVDRYAQIALAAPVHLSKLNLASFGYIHRIKNIRARNLWVLGHPDQAMIIAAEAVREAEELNHPFTLCYVLMSCVMVPLETGNWRRAEELIERLSTVAAKHHLATYARAAVGLEGRVAVARGDLSRGIRLLQTALTALREHGYELYRLQFSTALAEALAGSGQPEAAYRTICEEVAWADAHGQVPGLIEGLRAKGEILCSSLRAEEGESCLMQALELARQRGLLSLELRNGISLARVWADRGETDRARSFLSEIFCRFSEGFQTRDLLAAAKFLKGFRSRR